MPGEFLDIMRRGESIAILILTETEGDEYSERNFTGGNFPMVDFEESPNCH